MKPRVQRRGAETREIELVVLLGHLDQAVRFLKRQRLEEHCIHDAKDGGIRSNRKRDGNDDNRGEHWRAAHHPKCIANIG